MKLFFFVIGFLILFFAGIILVALQYVRRGIKKFQNAVTGDYDDEETFRRMADKHYRPKAGDPKFDKDYFKSKSGGGQGAYEAPKEQPRQRTTTTADGVTVIDERAPKEQRKIFTEEEGEYVDYTEV
jgi:hypothetical protein